MKARTQTWQIGNWTMHIYMAMLYIILDVHFYYFRIGGRSCAMAQRAFAEKFGLGGKF